MRACRVLKYTAVQHGEGVWSRLGNLISRRGDPAKSGRIKAVSLYRKVLDHALCRHQIRSRLAIWGACDRHEVKSGWTGEASHRR